MNVECPAPDALVEPRIDRVLTQYRESPKLLHLMRTYLRQVENVITSFCDLPSFFAIDTAVGDQLTFLGRRLGWPRCHCVCTVGPVFGFACEGITSDFTPLVGFCEGGNWQDCGHYGTSEICIDDDEIYRKFLKVRVYQIMSAYEMASLQAAVEIMWGPTAWIPETGLLRVVLAPGRVLTEYETALLKLVPRVMPVAPGIRVLFHFGVGPIFGFGAGWAGVCGEPGANIIANGENIVVNDENLITGDFSEGGDWLCEIDVRPYDC